MKSKHDIPAKQRKPWLIQRILNDWFNRLLGAASDRSFSDQEELYAANRTKRDYVWNSVGLASWGTVFPLLTIVATQLVGVEQAGMFSMAFVVGLLLMFLANYGVRTFQVSDIDETHSFADYQINRLITCIIMLAVGFLYCLLRGYSEDMFTISFAVYVYKMIDGLADVYEGRLQQLGKLYLAGISVSVRSLLAILVFTFSLLLTHNLPLSCIVMAVSSLISFFIVTLPLALLETPKSRKLSIAGIKNLFVQCFPLFLAIFMFNIIDTMPKFVMEGTLSYDNQLYFNAMYFPAQAILIAVQFIYKPQLVRMANLWKDRTQRTKFDLMILVILIGIAVLTLIMIVLINWIGVPVLSFLYGVDFTEFKSLMIIMLVAGGVTAGIDYLYQAITVLRKQASVTKLYFITFGLSLFIPVLLVYYAGLPGVVLSYLIIMSILFLLLITDYLTIRLGLSREAAAEAEALGDDRLSRWRTNKERTERQRQRHERLKKTNKDKDSKPGDKMS